TIRDLLDGPVRSSALPDRCRGRSVALRVTSPLLLAELLIQLDGLASRIVLLPPSRTAAQSDALLGLADPDLLVHDAAGTVTVGERRESKAPADSLAATMWVISTSGTTAAPKLVLHDSRSLTDAIKVTPEGGRFTWGLMYDMSRFAGLQVFLQALLGGSRLVLSDAGAPLAATLERFSLARVNALSASPTLWRKVLMSSQALDLEQVTLGGEAADQLILDALRRRFPKARVVHIYASTEAGVGFSVSDGLEGFPAEFVQSPPRGVEVRVSPEGFLELRKSHCASGYLGNSDRLLDSEGFIRTGDIVARIGSRFVFRGRANGAVNVGGDKVMPQEVEAVIRSVVGVDDVAVYGRRNSVSGMVVAAEVVLGTPLRERPADARRIILDACRAGLEPFKVPATVDFVPALRVTAAGKVERHAP
ncbi:MAG: fatty acid--CoA ligase family protein, partial [Cyanobacteria bacterium REEB65]|nr:fatty acid--CoA ligase family protein [Cyanobacteria bacterium REEB65]